MNSSVSKKQIASLALFRQLYNEKKADIMTILCEFIKVIINDYSLTTFTVETIEEKLRQDYVFKIPSYVIESALKKFCNRDNGRFFLKEGVVLQNGKEDELEKINKENDQIIENLKIYVERETKKALTEDESGKLVKSFCNFFLEEEDNNEYDKYVSAFIISIKDDEKYSEQLKRIKEGIILYEGIKYNDSINEVGSWTYEYTICLDQEILFHAAGYNGDLYKKLFDDFGELVRDINKKAKKQLVKLRYYPTTKEGIEIFFKTAENIVEGRVTLNNSNIAMSEITNECHDVTDIISKETQFWFLLKELGILEEEEIPIEKLCQSENYLEEKDMYDFLEEAGKDDREQNRIIKCLNNTSVKRGAKAYSFEKAKYIFLTGNSLIFSLANKKKEENEVPLAISLDRLTTKIWFKLNKGFGDKNYPQIFNVITKAQMVLSTFVQKSVAKEFDKLQKEYKDGKQNKETIVAQISELRERMVKPEDVSNENVEDTLQTITMADSEKYLREREIERQKAKETEKLLEEERKKNAQKDEDLLNISDESDSYRMKLMSLQEEKRHDLEEKIRGVEFLMKKAEGEAMTRSRFTIAIVIIGIVAIVIALYCYLGRTSLAEWVTIVSTCGTPIVLFVITAIYGKSGNPKTLCEKVYIYFREKKYIEYNVDISKYEKLKEILKTTESIF